MVRLEKQKKELGRGCYINSTMAISFARLATCALGLALFVFLWITAISPLLFPFEEISSDLATSTRTTTALARRDYYPSDVTLYERANNFAWYVEIGVLSVAGIGTLAAATLGCVVGTAGLATGVCIVGAFATAATFIGIGQRIGPPNRNVDVVDANGIYSFRDHIGKHGLAQGYIPARNAAEKEQDRQANQLYIDSFGSERKHYGWIAANSSVHGHLVPYGYQAWPIYEFHDKAGRKVHHVIVPNGDGHAIRMWYPSNEDDDSKLEKRHRIHHAEYNGESFKHGGLDIHACEAKGFPKAQLRKSDFEHMDEEMGCYLHGKHKKHNSVKLQIIDKSGEGTIAAGAIAVVTKEGKSAIKHRKLSNCKALKNRPHRFKKCSKTHTSHG